MASDADRASPPSNTRVRRSRDLLYRAAALFFALVWLTFGFGLIDLLAVTEVRYRASVVASPEEVGWLSIAYGSVATFLIAGALFGLAVRSFRLPAGIQQLVALAVAFAIAGVLGLDPLSFVSVAMLTIMLVILLLLHPRPRPALWPRGQRVERPVLVVGLLGLPAAVVYCWAMLGNSRARAVPEEEALRPQAGGWAGAAILAIAVLLLAILAAHHVQGRRLPAWSTLLAIAPVAWTSIAEPTLPGSPGQLGAVSAATWAVALVGTVEMTARGASP